MLAALLCLAARSVILVVPPAPRGDATDWASFGVAQAMTELVSQEPEATWVSLKQLDAVLRRRDLRITDASEPEVALPLARTVGATEVVVGDLRKVGDHYWLSAQRIAVATRKVEKSAHAEGGEHNLPAMAAQLARELLDTKGDGPDARSFEAVSRCQLGLLRFPLRPQPGAPPQLAPQGAPLGGAVGASIALDDAHAIEQQCRAALELAPASAAAHAGLSVLYSIAGDTHDALAESRAPKGFDAEAKLAESFALRKAGDEPGSRKALEEAVHARPGFLHALGYLAEDRMEEQDYKAALAAWDRYLLRAPDHPFALGQKGHALARLGRMTESLANTRRALDLDPGDAELLIELASRQIDAGQDREAEATLRQALEIYPPRPLAKLRLGFLYLRQKRAQDAHDILSEAATEAWREDEAPTRGLAFLDLAKAAELQGKNEEAAEYRAAAEAEGVKAK